MKERMLFIVLIFLQVSLGDYIFMVPDFPKESFKHELGHCYQSQLLGWLYIPVIAIPSVLHNLYVRIARKLGYKPDYYSFYTEKWADHLVEKIG
nr:MAG TPA: Calcium homeostasis modulator [Crassvirales sp.]